MTNQTTQSDETKILTQLELEFTTEKTITQSNTFGRDTQLTKIEFVKIWKEYIREVSRLCSPNSEYNEKYNETKNWGMECAGKEFDRIWKNHYN